MKAQTFENAFPLEHLLPNLKEKELILNCGEYYFDNPFFADFEISDTLAKAITIENQNSANEGFKQGYEYAQSIINKKLKPYGSDNKK